MSLKGLKVLFMGTPSFSLPTLSALIEAGCDIVGVVTQPDRPKGRGRKIISSPVKEIAEAEGLFVYQPQRVREDSFIDRIRALSPDAIVVVAFGQILPKTLLEIPQMGCVNVHASILPVYRGAAPINWAVANGEKSTGVTTMLMDEGLDTGDILMVKEIAIAPDDNSETLYHRLSGEGAKLLISTLEGLKNGAIKPVRQNEKGSSYAPLLKKENGIISWSKSAEEIVNLVRGMLPWPVAHTTFMGKGLKIFKACRGSACGRPGEISHVGRDFLEVAAGRDSVVILDLQMEGKRRMTAEEFLRGCKVTEGEVVGV